MIENINEYLNKHNAQKMNAGQSGVNVYQIDNSFVLKHARRDNK